MAETASRLMTPEEFFHWQMGQEDLYELVDGVPVKMLKMMTGASVQHDLVVVNIIALRIQLRGSGYNLALPLIGASLPLREVFEGLGFA